ncbi:MAG: 2-oxoacid:acceptor oxidoreductase subunit alpha, partial [Candidatus Eisenbacteria bacterium]|nr:2-oxoacid:acceptor oxidoreductase subunit alpha [Candidatus Latescibacterota bacterium]MBD3302815.1 2-oxoacid:acceptor oxidoreductase subunit alpha [Candidatus Eisenbacteria bacterium]
YDVLIAFNDDSYVLHSTDFAKTGVLLINGEPDKPAVMRHPELENNIVYHVPMERIARKEIGEPRSKNMVAIGATSALFGFERELLEANIRERFGKRSEKILEDNLGAFRAGFRYVEENIEKKDPYQLRAAKGEGFFVLTGNEAVALGAVYAGCRFFGGYPITPASEIMEVIAAELPRIGGAMVQAEDEIASMGMVLGAAFSGVRSMTATSGPGLSLMAELIGLASMAELPCVIVDVQRGGPSTGLPTKTEQADLALALTATHGEAPHVVLAPMMIQDSFTIMRTAFDIAEEFQLPVIVLTEQSLGFRRSDLPKSMLRDAEKWEFPPRSVPEPDEGARYYRYRLTESGVSPRAIPGMAGLQHVVTGLEHAEDGKPAYDPKTRRAMMEKRYRKLDGIIRKYTDVVRYGEENEKVDVGVIGWGSTAGPIKEAVDVARKNGIKAAGLVPRLLYPSPNEPIGEFIRSCKKVIVAEGNMTGQYARFLRSEFPGFDPEHFNSYTGMPIRYHDILAKIEEVA